MTNTDDRPFPAHETWGIVVLDAMPDGSPGVSIDTSAGDLSGTCRLFAQCDRAMAEATLRRLNGQVPESSPWWRLARVSVQVIEVLE